MKIAETVFNTEKTYNNNRNQMSLSMAKESKPVDVNHQEDGEFISDYTKDQRTSTNRYTNFLSVLVDEKIVYVNNAGGLSGICVKASSVEKYLINYTVGGGFDAFYSAISPLRVDEPLVSDGSQTGYDYAFTPSINYSMALSAISKFPEGTDISAIFTTSSEYTDEGYEWFNLGVTTEDIIYFAVTPNSYVGVATGHLIADFGYPVNDASMFNSIFSAIEVKRAIKI